MFHSKSQKHKLLTFTNNKKILTPNNLNLSPNVS